ncbi:MAG: hypothetical protein AB7S38_14625 [Vulcanimicrobiota bacterium]
MNLSFAQFGGEIDQEDRQCAWEFYCELTTRVGVRGRLDGSGSDVFTGEILVESLESLCTFFQTSRIIMKKYPVGRVAAGEANLGFAIAQLLEFVVRPFLEKWQATYRYWWTVHQDGRRNPFALQAEFPKFEELTKDWVAVRKFCRSAAHELAKAYHLIDLLDLAPDEARQQQVNETAAVCRLI